MQYFSFQYMYAIIHTVGLLANLAPVLAVVHSLAGLENRTESGGVLG